jgi:hypothetical protein
LDFAIDCGKATLSLPVIQGYATDLKAYKIAEKKVANSECIVIE